jgi:hypothetical protein
MRLVLTLVVLGALGAATRAGALPDAVLAGPAAKVAGPVKTPIASQARVKNGNDGPIP